MYALNFSWAAWITERPGVSKATEPDSDEIHVETLIKSDPGEGRFRYIRRVFGHDKVRYRGQAKNRNRYIYLATFSNLLIGAKFPPHGIGGSEFRPNSRNLSRK